MIASFSPSYVDKKGLKLVNSSILASQQPKASNRCLVPMETDFSRLCGSASQQEHRGAADRSLKAQAAATLPGRAGPVIL